jgi:N-acetylneuraminic acid mutarotase
MRHRSPLVVAIFATAALTLRADDPKAVGRIFHSMVWTGREVLIWGGGSEGVFHRSGLRIDPSGADRTVIADRDAPAGRWGHAAVWSGTEMIVWGGRNQFQAESHFSDGARYNPVTDAWSPMSASGAPTSRSQMAAVWTGEEMLVWGGYGDGATAWNSGGRYDPRTDSWRSMSESGFLEARVLPVFAWTGKELLVWGGITPDLKRTFGDGARYDTATDRWSPIKRDPAAPAVWGSKAVWTGTEMLVWGGSLRNGDDAINQVTARGAAYDPVKDAWRPIRNEGAPSARFFHDAVWTGKRLVVWGGGDQGEGGNHPKHFDDGAQYDPVEDRWAPLDWKARPAARGMHTAVWMGRKMMVFGGSTGGSTAFSDAAIWSGR